MLCTPYLIVWLLKISGQLLMSMKRKQTHGVDNSMDISPLSSTRNKGYTTSTESLTKSLVEIVWAR